MQSQVSPADVIPPKLSGKLRIVRRSRQVSSVLLSHGLADVLTRLQLPSWMISERSSAAGDASMTTPARACQALEELGPTFVKLGQFLSTRRDLLSEDWLRELSRLQDAVLPVPWAQIRDRLRSSLGDRMDSEFSSIDVEPLAAGSVAQVHRAWLVDGTPVVLKVLRPGIRAVIQSDLEVLGMLAAFSEKHGSNLGFRPRELLREFSQDRMAELDLVHEGRATDRLRRLFRDDPGVVFPRVHWSVTTPRVLALDFLDGVPVSRLNAETVKPEVAASFVEHGCRAVVRQCLEYGFFHADPHPGNVLLMPGGNVGFVDCGITGFLDSGQRSLFMDLVRQIIAKDAEGCQRTAIALVEADRSLADDRHLRRSIQDLLVDLGSLNLVELDVSMLLTRLFSILREEGVAIQGDLVKLLKALAAVESTAAILQPEFALAPVVAEELELLVVRSMSPRALMSQLAAGASSYLSFLRQLPRGLDDLLTKLLKDEIRVQLTHGGLGKLTAAILFASRLLAGALIVASLLVSGSILLLASRELGLLGRWLGAVSLGFAVLLGGLLAAKHFRYLEDRS